ncbi:hypothetical protein BBJ28_00021026 [Nothophytophthora sp. Chile5]|nr:hypothetical protein BBJ28_00021026 [Nothophytophthora sp. Chile5]
MNPVDEALAVPLFDVQGSRVVFIPIKYVLDFVFYHDGKRRAPRHVVLGTFLFEGASAPSPLATPPPSSLPNREVDDMLSDSEGDSDGEMERHRYDMTDFSPKNKLPTPALPAALDDLIEALDGVVHIVDYFCQSDAVEIFHAARAFLTQLRVTTGPPDAMILLELVHWVNGRLERFRALLAQGDSATAANVKFDFSVSHVSYVQIMQSVTQQQIAELLRASEQPRGEQSRWGEVRRNHGRGQGRPGTRQQVLTVPTDILRALPSYNGKSLCMKYLAVNTCRGRGDDCLDGVTCSPFGAVQKGDIPLAEDARVIHDLSYPPGDSVNDHTAVGSTIDISYDGAVSIARRIVEVEDAFPGRARMMAGDVSGAFRHILLHASAVGRFAGTIPSLGVLIIDLACPFGWTDSLGHYWVAGSAIKHIYGSSAPRWPFQRTVGAADFDATAWCDDHISVEPDVGSRLDEAGLALRSAMVQVLGPDACNVDKFTEWFTRGQALGLCWDLHQATVSIPANKIAKAEGRLLAMLATRTTTRKALNELLGSLRHVCSCVRSATAFVQSIGDLSRSTSCSRRVINSEAAKDDVRWFLVVLRTARLNSIPLTRFAAVQSPDWHIFMDASDRGLCALFPARREYLQVEFTEDAQARIRAFNSQGTSDFGINLRELLSATFASIMWVDANAAQFGAFAVYLWQWGMNHRGRGNTYSIVCAKLSAVRWYHRSNLGYDPGVNAGHTLLLKGIRRFTSPVLKQQPITVAILRSVRTRLNLSQPRSQLLWGGLLLACFFLLRRSEYLHLGRRHHAYVLRLGNVSFHDAGGNPCSPRKAKIVGVTLHGAKNNQFGREECRYHQKSGDRIICPVHAARWVMKGAAAFNTQKHQPALATGGGTGITAKELAYHIKAAARTLGLNETRFSTHSVRVGGATKLLNAGADRLVIKLMGRWLSNTFEEYPVLTAEGSADLARLMI